MRLTQKLISFLHRKFDKAPGRELALRVRYQTGVMSWQVADAALYLTADNSPAPTLTIDLTAYTIANLASYIAAQPGFTVEYMAPPELNTLSARVLLDGSNDIAQSNGDHLYAYTSPLWSFMEAAANELEQAEKQIVQAIRQMSTKTANGEWLDELGGYYGVPRLASEPDISYGPRIIAEVIRPRGNNVAIEAAIKTFTGQTTRVTDVTSYIGSGLLYNNAFNHNSSHNYDSTSANPLYGLFDVELGYDLLNGGDISSYQSTITDLVGRLRDAGTHLRNLSLISSSLYDDFTANPSDAADLTINLANYYDGGQTHQGIIDYSGARTSSESL